MESCPSGWRSTPGKRVYGDTVPRVRISHSPPFFYLKTGSFHRFIWILAGFRCILDCSILVLRKAVSWTSSGPEGSSDKWIAVCAARVPGCCGPMYNELTSERRLFLCLKSCLWILVKALIGNKVPRLARCDIILSLIHIWRCRRLLTCRSRWSPYH